MPTSAQILEAPDNEVCIPPALFRLVQLVLLPEALGANSGAVLYVAAKRFSRALDLHSIQALKEWFVTMQLGDLEVQLDEGRCSSSSVMSHLSRSAGCGFATLRFRARPHRRRARGRHRHRGRHQRDNVRGPWRYGLPVRGLYRRAGGYLYFENGFHPEAQRRLLAGIADQSAVALDNLRLLSERRYAETHDALTGLYNFRHGREHAALEIGRAARYGRHVTFVMLDLDGFSQVNAEVGRLRAATRCWAHWAAALTAQLRTCDLLCRYGADEFLVVMPETTETQADVALARLLHGGT